MKYIKKFEISAERMFEPPKKHNPKHKYDCANCKFNWCCGFSCRCNQLNPATVRPLPDAPPDSLYGSREKFNL